MRVEQGYAVITDRLSGRITREMSVFKCAHCSHKVHTPTLRSHQFSTCFNCDDGMGRGLICESCIGKPCTPFMRTIEAAEARERFRRMAGA